MYIVTRIQNPKKKTASVIILQNKIIIGRRNVLMRPKDDYSMKKSLMAAHNEQKYLSILSEFIWTAA